MGEGENSKPTTTSVIVRILVFFPGWLLWFPFQNLKEPLCLSMYLAGFLFSCIQGESQGGCHECL